MAASPILTTRIDCAIYWREGRGDTDARRAARREAKIASLKAAFVEVDVQTMEEIPMTAEAILAILQPHMAKAIRENPLERDSAEEAEAEAARAMHWPAWSLRRPAGMSLTGWSKASNKKKAAKAAAEEAKAELAELAAGGANVPSADDAAGNMPLRPDADPEIKKLRKQLRHSVSRTNYDQIVAQLKDTKMRLVEALSKAKEAPAAAPPPSLPSVAESSSSAERPLNEMNTPRPDWAAVTAERRHHRGVPAGRACRPYRCFRRRARSVVERKHRCVGRRAEEAWTTNRRAASRAPSRAAFAAGY